MSNTRIPIAVACLLGLVALLVVTFFATPLLSPKKLASPLPYSVPDTAPRLAPNGTYYLLEPTSITTHSGIYRLTPGTELKLLSRENDRLHLTDGQVELDLDVSEVTDDLDIADLVRENHNDLLKRIAGIQIRPHREPTAAATANDSTGPAPESTPRRLVPPGYYCLMRRVSRFTDSGVVAWPPGTRLALMSRSSGKVRLTDGDSDMTLDESDVTNDMEIAELVQQNYIDLQSRIRQILLGHYGKKKPLGARGQKSEVRDQKVGPEGH